jgi:GAF domain-containing protein
VPANDPNPDRRRFVRHAVHTPAFASFDGVTGGMILDLSEQGLSMQTAGHLEANRRIQIQVGLLDPINYVETTGYVAWADALGRAGVRFSDLPAEARQRLREWLTLNDTSPSRMAPKLNVSGQSSGYSTGDGNGHTRSAITLETGVDTLNDFQSSPRSTTAQYEFNSLGSNLSGALRLVSERARSLTRGTGAAIALSHAGFMICRASVGANAPAFGARLDSDSGISAECIRSGKSQRCDDAETDPRVNRDTCQLLKIRSILAAPIQYEREVLGILEVFSTESFAFDEGDVAVVERLAQTVLLAMSDFASTPRGG